MKALFTFYYTQFKIELAQNFQYRVALFLWLIGLFVEPIVYLIVWTTVAKTQGGAVGGYTAGAFAAYFIVSTLVRQMCSGLSGGAFDELVKQGSLSPLLLRPIHPFHVYLASFFGFKLMTFILWIPVGTILIVLFKPALNPELWQIIDFSLAVLLGFLLRFSLDWALGLSNFWLTRVNALFQLYYTIELLLSGRLVPISLLPQWGQNIANLLPFRWAFGFPVELLIGRLSLSETLTGFVLQGIWILVAILTIGLLWRLGLKRYTAVGA